MCILSYLPPHVEPDERGLFNGGIKNGDGHGWAIVAGDRIIRQRHLDLMDALESFVDARAANMEGPALFHSRWMTHGTWAVDNVHPFHVGYSDKTVVAHNGVLPSAAHPGPGDKRSDTRIFADEILPHKYRWLDKPSVNRALHQFCGGGNKLVILTVDPRYQCNAYLINRKAGIWDEDTGIWHSNSAYKSLPPLKSKKYPSTITVYRSDGEGGYVEEKQDYADYRADLARSAVKAVTSASESAAVFSSAKVCEFCQEGMVDQAGYCVSCGSCAHCLEYIEDCECYSEFTMPREPDGEPTEDDVIEGEILDVQVSVSAA